MQSGHLGLPAELAHGDLSVIRVRDELRTAAPARVRRAVARARSVGAARPSPITCFMTVSSCFRTANAGYSSADCETLARVHAQLRARRDYLAAGELEQLQCTEHFTRHPHFLARKRRFEPPPSALRSSVALVNCQMTAVRRLVFDSDFARYIKPLRLSRRAAQVCRLCDLFSRVSLRPAGMMSRPRVSRAAVRHRRISTLRFCAWCERAPASITGRAIA